MEYINTVKPCPFCGHDVIALVTMENIQVGLSFDSHYAACTNCQATGPLADWSREHNDTKRRARELWEQRA